MRPDVFWAEPFDARSPCFRLPLAGGMALKPPPHTSNAKSSPNPPVWRMAKPGGIGPAPPEEGASSLAKGLLDRGPIKGQFEDMILQA